MAKILAAAIALGLETRSPCVMPGVMSEAFASTSRLQL
jgi:hypothetical protein